MSPGRYEGRDGLLLVAATTILVLTFQQFWQGGAAKPAGGFAGQAPASPPRQADPDAARANATGSWKSILWGVYQRSDDDRLLATAAGVVFFGLLAVFPAVTALVSSYGLFADPSTIGANLQSLALMLPEGSFQIVQDQIARVLDKGPAALGGTFLFGLALALWSANAGVKAIIDALNVVHERRETRSFIRLNLLSLAFTTGGIAALLLMVSAVVAFPLAIDRLGLPADFRFILGLARWPLLFAVLLLALSVLYRFGPNRPDARWEWTRAGTLAAALLWIAGSASLSWYLSNFSDYNATYGSLGAAIGLMMWMWMSATVVLFGGELNSEIERQTPVDGEKRAARPLAAVPAVLKEH
jgi:membrane protein